MNLDRYQRHSLIDWFSQDDLKASSFAVIGCGAVGNEVAKNLALLGSGRLDLFDFDTIEIHNLTRSVLFREGDVGRNKADVARDRLQNLDPNIEVNSHPGDFWDLLTLDQVKSYDCVLCCVDNFEARIRLNQLCLLAETNLINTGIDSKFCQIEIFPFASGKHVACYECNLPNTAYERMQNRYSCGWLKKISFVEKKIPTTIITSSLTGALAASNAIRLINEKSRHDAQRILVDSFTGNSTVSTIALSSSCPACADLGDRVFITKGSPLIQSEIPFSLDSEQITTSDPVLVSLRCTVCSPNTEDSTLIFEKAENFDSGITQCGKCNNESVEVIIRDNFEVKYLLDNFEGHKIPSKFIRFDNEDITTIIDLE